MGYATKLGGKSSGGSGLPSEILFAGGFGAAAEYLYGCAGNQYISGEFFNLLLDNGYSIKGYRRGNFTLACKKDSVYDQNVVLFNNYNPYIWVDVTSVVNTWKNNSYVEGSDYYLSMSGSGGNSLGGLIKFEKL